MSELTDTLEDQIINHFFRNNSQSSPANVYLGLFTSAPSDSGPGAGELSDGVDGYARESITFGAASPSGVSTNTNTLTFTASGGDWGNITHAAVFDASTGGNMFMWTPITSVTVNDGDGITFSPGNITITLD